MIRHAIFLGGSNRATVVQPAISTWRPSHSVSWKVCEVPDYFVNDGQTDVSTLTVVDSYAPPKAAKVVPITPRAGSWAETVNRERT